MDPIERKMLEVLEATLAKGIGRYVDASLIPSARMSAVGEASARRLRTHWCAKIRGRDEDRSEDQIIAFASLCDYRAWGQVLGLIYLYGEDTLLYRKPCHPECPVCAALYEDALGRPLRIPASELVQAPINNLDSLKSEISSPDGTVLSPVDWGNRVVGACHRWDTPEWAPAREVQL